MATSVEASARRRRLRMLGWASGAPRRAAWWPSGDGWSGVTGRRAAIAIIAAATIATVANLWLGGKVGTNGTRALDGWGILLGGVAVAGVGLSWTRPRLALVVVFGALLAYSALGYPSQPGQFAGGVVLFLVFIHGARVEAVAVGILVTLLVLSIAPGALGDASLRTLARVALVAIPSVPLVAGYLVTQHARRVELLERELRLERQKRLAESQRDAANLRVQLARDLHDTVGHAISVISVQSGAALSVLDNDTESARESLLAINESCRTAMAETRRALAALRGEASAAPPSIETIIATAEAAGLDVVVTRRGDLGDVDRHTQEVVRRLAQESLTNTLKHSLATRIEISLLVDTDAVRFELTDIGPPADDSGSRRPAGAGLDGMASRVAECGGTFDAHPTPSGFTVGADIPVLT